MKNLALASLILIASVGIADAHHAKHHPYRATWQATTMSQKQSCSGHGNGQAWTNACGAYSPDIDYPSPVRDQ